MANSGLKSNNTSGVKGVSWSKSKSKWRAHIMVSGKQLHLGYYDNIEAATGARMRAEQEQWGEFVTGTTEH
jgi:hypothetical protein